MRAVLLGFVLLAGCSDTEIIGSLQPVGSPIQLVGVTGAVTSIGLLDDQVLLTTVEPVTPPPGWSPNQDHTLAARIQWVGTDGTIGPATELGWSTWSTIAPRWIRSGDRLVGAVWAVAGPDEQPLPSTNGIALWAVSPTDTAGCHDAPRLPVYQDPESDTIDLFGQYYDANTLAPIAMADGRPVAVGAARPQWMCLWPRLLTLSMERCTAAAAYPITVDPCAPPGADDPIIGTATAVSLGSDLGILFRQPDGSDTTVRWLVLAGGTTPSGNGVRVGAGYHLPTPGAAGAQPRGALAGGRVAFFETTSGDGTCFSLRTMDPNGGGASDAAWQLPCVQEHGSTTTNVDLLPVSGAAIAVANELTSGGDALLHVNAVTAAGRRGSEAVELTVADGTVGAPFFRAAVDGNQVAVVYQDSAGLWLQRIRFVPN